MVFNSVTIFNNDSVIDLDIKIAIDFVFQRNHPIGHWQPGKLLTTRSVLNLLAPNISWRFLTMTKNPVARKDSNFISVVPIVLLSSLRFYCTC